MFKWIPQLNNLKSSPGATDGKDKYAYCAKVPNEYKSNSNSLDSPFSFQQAIFFFLPYPRHKEYLSPKPIFLQTAESRQPTNPASWEISVAKVNCLGGHKVTLGSGRHTKLAGPEGLA